MRVTIKGPTEAASLGMRGAFNIAVSKLTSLPAFDRITKAKFRYADDRPGYLGVALLYSQAKNKVAFLVRNGIKEIEGWLSTVSETLLSMVQEQESQFVIARAA
jgi:hypothetical protein